MNIRFNRNEFHTEPASPTGLTGLFSGKNKARIHLGSPTDDSHSIALIKDRTFTKQELTLSHWEKALDRFHMLQWVALKVQNENGEDVYLKVNRSSLKNREGLSEEELQACTEDHILDPTKNEKLRYRFLKKEAFDKVSENGNDLAYLSAEFKKDYEVIFAAVQKNPEAVRFIDPQVPMTFDGEVDKDQRSMKRKIREEVLAKLPSLSKEVQKLICDPDHPWTPFFLGKANLEVQKEVTTRNPKLLRHASMEVVLEKAKIEKGIQLQLPNGPKETFDQIFGRLSTQDQLKWLCGKPGEAVNKSHPEDFQLLSDANQKKAIINIESSVGLRSAHTFFLMANESIQKKMAEEFPSKYWNNLPSQTIE